MENLVLRLKNAPYFRCERGDDSVPVCRKCETCVLAWKVFSTKEWFRRVGESSQTRFLVSVLAQLDSLYLLHYFQNILQTTQGKDFVYHRSRVNLSNQEGRMAKFSLNQRLDKTVEQKMRELLCWFGNSTHQMKVNYTLLLMQMCQPKLLLTAASVIRVLFQREWSSVSGRQGRRERLEGPRTRSPDPRAAKEREGWTSSGRRGFGGVPDCRTEAFVGTPDPTDQSRSCRV